MNGADKQLSDAVWRQRYKSRPVPAIVRQYADAHDLGEPTIRWLKLIVIRFADFCGHDLTAEDFHAAKVNAWLTAMTAQAKVSRTTIKSYRRGLLIVWRWGNDEGLLPHPPIKVKKIRAPLPVPRGFTIDEMQRLIAAAAKLTGKYRCGVRRSLFFVAILRTGWDTGFRPSDLMRLKLADFNSSGCGGIAQHKTGQPVPFQLSTATMVAIAALGADRREFIFGGVVSRTKFYKTLRKVAAAAGVKGAMKTVRKGSASAVEAAQPGWGGRFLGHVTPGIFERHYKDPRIANVNRPVPPSLPPGIDGENQTT